MPLSNYMPSSRVNQPGVCTSTTRPAAPYKGQFIYETDTDMVAVYNGTGWRYIAATTPTNGTVLQVQSSVISNSQTVLATTTWTDLFGLSATITPRSASSKVLVIASLSAYFTTANGTGNAGGGIRLVRNGSSVMQPGPADSSGSYMTYSAAGGNISVITTLQLLDSPATTATVTYSLQGHSYNANITAYFNPNPAQNPARCVITMMEIAA